MHAMLASPHGDVLVPGLFCSLSGVSVAGVSWGERAREFSRCCCVSVMLLWRREDLLSSHRFPQSFDSQAQHPANSPIAAFYLAAFQLETPTLSQGPVAEPYRAAVLQAGYEKAHGDNANN